MAEAGNRTRSRRAAVAFGAIDVVTAVLIYIGVFEGLPARHWLVDGGAALLIVLFGGAGIGLLADSPWASRAALAASATSLALGLALVSVLSLTASYLSGIYGPVGRGGALILGLVAALALPYLVAVPLAQLVWAGKALRGGSVAPPPASSAPEA